MLRKKGTRCVCACANVRVWGHQAVDKTLGRNLGLLDSRNYFYCNLQKENSYFCGVFLSTTFSFFLSGTLGARLTTHFSSAMDSPRSHCQAFLQARLLPPPSPQHDKYFPSSGMVSVQPGEVLPCVLSCVSP